jgi:hypothetical protein
MLREHLTIRETPVRLIDNLREPRRMEMGKATDTDQQLMTRPLSEDEIRRRQRAAMPRTRLEATLDGRLVEPAPVPRETPREIYRAPQQTID